MRSDDLYVVAPDGTLVPFCPEVLGDDCPTIRRFLADTDRSKLFTLEDLRRMDQTEN